MGTEVQRPLTGRGCLPGRGLVGVGVGGRGRQVSGAGCSGKPGSTLRAAPLEGF